MPVNEKGFENKNIAQPEKSVGPQGDGGAKKGKKVMGVNNPRGQEPQKLGGGLGPLSRDGNQPKVGK